jgi:hypothetical protein
LVYYTNPESQVKTLAWVLRSTHPPVVNSSLWLDIRPRAR